MMVSPIEIDPNKLGGKPVFPGSRVPIETLLEYLESPDETIETFLEDFPPITRAQVREVLAYLGRGYLHVLHATG